MSGRRARTARDERRRSYGQNFASRALAAQLVREAGVGPDDLVVELGAGSGVLTAELARRARRVWAIELDRVWADHLRERFGRNARVAVIEGDLLRAAFPTEPFRVVANPPFGATTALLRRLLDDPGRPLARADLVLQWEVARKRAREPRSALGASWCPWWRFRLGRRIPRTAFRPVPAVDAGVLVVERRATPLLPPSEAGRFAAFARALVAGTLAPELDARTWVAVFDAYTVASARGHDCPPPDYRHGGGGTPRA